MNDENNRIIIKNNVVYKDIKRSYAIFHVPIIQNQLFLQGLSCPKIEKYTIRDFNSVYYSYLFVKGKETERIDDEEYVEVVNNISKQITNCNLQSMCNVSFYDKIDIFLGGINIDKECLPEYTMISSVKEIYSDIRTKYRCTHLIHGDLDSSNIIWNGEKYIVIDFDECCLAPEGMDCAIALARLIQKRICNGGDIPLKYGKLLIEYQIDIELIKLYIIKVIVEKIYLLQEEIIDLKSIEQRIDSVELWYKIFGKIDLLMGL